MTKIGYSHDTNIRLEELQAASGRDLRFVSEPVPGDKYLEQALQEFFADRRGHGEWFAGEITEAEWQAALDETSAEGYTPRQQTDPEPDDSQAFVTPKKQRKKRVLPKTLRPEEVEALMKAPNTRYITGLRNRCMMELMYRAGLRVSEVCNLRPRDVDVKEGEVTVLKGKGGDRKAIFEKGSVLDVLLPEWTKRRRRETDGGDYLFCTTRGKKKVAVRYVEAMVDRMARRAGITEHVTPHMLRHTFATELLQDGTNIRIVQESLGHKHLATTEIYTHVTGENIKDAIRNRKRRT